MENYQYTGEKPMVKMSQEEYDKQIADMRKECEVRIAEASEKAYQMALSDCEKKIKEAHAELEMAKKDNLLLQVKHDQLLRTTKELALCLQYETGNGFVK